MHRVQHDVAHALLAANVINVVESPITFKSGIISPVYIDNRRLPYFPEHWRTAIVAFQTVLEAQAAIFDVIAGIETAGIPHSAALSYSMRRPSVFVRKQPKDHGTQQRVEGGEVRGKRVLLVEDQVTTGGSSLSGVLALRESGAVVEDCLAITSYSFAEAIEAFTEAGVRLHTLTTFNVILEVGEKSGKFSADEVQRVRDWLGDPRGWTERHSASERDKQI
jgi:orotate phosphoribosyltransferase